MKILMVSSYLPYPPHSGGHVRLYNLLKELSGRHEITLLCEIRPHQTEEDVAAVEKICHKVITVLRPKPWLLKNILMSTFSSRSFLVTSHTNPLLQEKIAAELRTHTFDLIHVETFYVMQNLLELRITNQELRGLPIVLVEHNIEYLVYQRFLARAPIPLRPLLALDIKKIEREEEATWRNATKLVAVSEEDKKVMEKAGFSPGIVANGVDLEQFAFTKKKEINGKILFLGDFKWIQNRDSVMFIIREIWPRLRQGFGGQPSSNPHSVRLWAVGRKIPESIRSLTNNPDVIFDEESSVKPASEIFQEASILLAPIRIGGGTSYKILEAMSCGTPVVTMPLSANALHAKDGEHVLTGNTAQSLAEKALLLLQDDSLYERIRKNGRALVEEKYSWKEIGKELEEVYESC